MWTNNYDGVIETWKVDLIVSRAKRFGFKQHELEDIQQDLVLHVLDFEFDEARSNGATEATVLTALIDNNLRLLRRTDERYRKHVEAMGPRPEIDDSQDVRHQERALDVADIINGLSQEERELCQALSEGQTIAEHATQIGSCWHSVKRTAEQLADHFDVIQWDDFVPECP